MINHPVYTASEALTRETFLALMWSLSYPGRVYELPCDVLAGGAFHAIADTLLDLETSTYTPDALLAEYLAYSGARALAPERAAYHFYPALDVAQLATVARADAGTLLYPDHGATLFIGCEFESAAHGATTLKLNGPGIPPAAPVTVEVSGIPEEFWARRAAHRYPLGWDVYLVGRAQIVGLPRTTRITVED